MTDKELETKPEVKVETPNPENPTPTTPEPKPTDQGFNISTFEGFANAMDKYFDSKKPKEEPKPEKKPIPESILGIDASKIETPKVEFYEGTTIRKKTNKYIN